MGVWARPRRRSEPISEGGRNGGRDLPLGNRADLYRENNLLRSYRDAAQIGIGHDVDRLARVLRPDLSGEASGRGPDEPDYQREYANEALHGVHSGYEQSKASTSVRH
jgi:hypothetical protein